MTILPLNQIWLNFSQLATFSPLPHAEFTQDSVALISCRKWVRLGSLLSESTITRLVEDSGRNSERQLRNFDHIVRESGLLLIFFCEINAEFDTSEELAEVCFGGGARSLHVGHDIGQADRCDNRRLSKSDREKICDF